MRVICSKSIKQRSRAAKWIGIGAVAILMIVAASIAFAPINDYYWRRSFPPKFWPVQDSREKMTWDRVPETIKEGMQSRVYRNGGLYLENSTSIQSDENKKDAVYHLLIDFLDSLSPGQVETIKNEPFLFSHLTPKQQSNLLRIAEICDVGTKYEARKDSRYSVILLTKYTLDGSHRERLLTLTGKRLDSEFHFYWLYPLITDDGQHIAGCLVTVGFVGDWVRNIRRGGTWRYFATHQNSQSPVVSR